MDTRVKQLLRNITYAKHFINKLYNDKETFEVVNGSAMYRNDVIWIKKYIDYISRKTKENVHKAYKHTKPKLRQQESTN